MACIAGSGARRAGPVRTTTNVIKPARAGSSAPTTGDPTPAAVAVSGGGGTRAAGLAVVQAKLGEWGVPLEGIYLVDGSGLDRGNRLTCSALQAVLRHVGGTGPVADGLPIAGRTGTLVDAFRGNPAEGRLHAKTGTTNTVVSLAGYVTALNGEVLAFTFIYNGRDRFAARSVMDRMGPTMANFYRD